MKKSIMYSVNFQNKMWKIWMKKNQEPEEKQWRDWKKKDKRINGVYCRILKLHLNQFNALILISRAYCIPKVTTMTVGQFVIIYD